jgi:hypothetical protein
MGHRILFLALGAVLGASPLAQAAQCTAASGERRVPLLELYTSEGCDSCPPADRWLSGLPGRGFNPDRVVALAFHVDYWNYIGWVDPYSQSRYSERQRQAAARNQSRFVYTPQFMVNGKDYRRGTWRDDFGEKVAAVNREKPHADLRLALNVSADALAVSGSAMIAGAAERAQAQAWFALYENNLASNVTAGENRGKRLAHDFVVRDIVGPLAVDAQGRVALEHRFKLDSRWKPKDLGVAAFVQNARSGDVLQALALGCAPR